MHRLNSDGAIEVIIDEYDFKEGGEKYAFMERMVNDPSVIHVLVFSDKLYAEKADGRKGGVGTEHRSAWPKRVSRSQGFSPWKKENVSRLSLQGQQHGHPERL